MTPGICTQGVSPSCGLSAVGWIGVCLPARRCEHDTVVEGSVYPVTQAEVDTLQGCEVILGTLHIERFPVDDWPSPDEWPRRGVLPAEDAPSSLAALSNLREVRDSLSSNNCVVSVLEALHSLQRVGSLAFQNCQEPANLAELGPFAVAESLVVANSPGISSLTGLGLSAELGSVQLSGAVLVDFPSPLTSSADPFLAVRIRNNPVLAELRGAQLAGERPPTVRYRQRRAERARLLEPARDQSSADRRPKPTAPQG